VRHHKNARHVTAKERKSMSENICPTCLAAGDDPCVTASGAKAKKNHATRKMASTAKMTSKEMTVLLESSRETDKQRFDKMISQRRVDDALERERKAKLVDTHGSVLLAQLRDPEKFRPVPNRASRRANGMRKTIHRGALRRFKIAKANAEVRAFFAPEPAAEQADVSIAG
jgi:hypothetical protein